MMSFDIASRLLASSAKRFWAVACSGLLLAVLTGCGGGTVHDPFTPSRIISFGDALSDITSGQRYTVNATDGQILTMVEQVAANYGFTATAIVTSAKGNARIASADTLGTGAPSLSTQVSTYVSGTTVIATDLFMMSAGISDLIAQYQTFVTAGSTTAALSAMNAALDTAAVSYVGVVQTLVSANAKRIIVVPPYNLSVTPWANDGTYADRATMLDTMTRRFNDKLLTTMANTGLDGRIVVYAPIEYEMNRVASSASNILSLTDLATPICDTPALDATNGIGIGTGQLNSKKCTDSTLISVTSTSGTVTATLSAYAFADKIYPTPIVLRDLGAAIYNAAYAR